MKPTGWLTLAIHLLGAPVCFAQSQELHIPVILPLTGSGAFLGQAEQTALHIAEKLTNEQGGIGGRQLRFDISDDGAMPQNGMLLMRKAISQKPALILGSAIVSVCNATAPLLKNGPVQYCFSPAIHPAAGSYVFTSGPSTIDAYHVTLRYVMKRGWTKIGYIVSSDATGQDGEKAILEAVKTPEFASVELVARTHFDPGDLSVAAQVTTVRSAAPQAILVIASGTGAGTVLNSLAQAGVDLPVVTLFSNMTYGQMSAYKPYLPQELYFPSGQWPEGGANVKPEVQKAKAALYAAYAREGLRPDMGAVLAWDPTMITIAALRALGPDADSAQIRRYLASLENFAGVNGIYNFKTNPQRGLDESDLVITRWNAVKERWDIVSTPGGTPGL